MSDSRRHPHVVNIDEVAPDEQAQGYFAFRRCRLATPMTLDIVGYPDSKKFAFAAGVDPAKGLRSGWVMKVVREDQANAGYYDGEPLAQK